MRYELQESQSSDDSKYWVKYGEHIYRADFRKKITQMSILCWRVPYILNKYLDSNGHMWAIFQGGNGQQNDPFKGEKNCLGYGVHGIQSSGSDSRFQRKKLVLIIRTIFFYL